MNLDVKIKCYKEFLYLFIYFTIHFSPYYFPSSDIMTPDVDMEVGDFRKKSIVGYTSAIFAV